MYSRLLWYGVWPGYFSAVPSAGDWSGTHDAALSLADWLPLLEGVWRLSYFSGPKTINNLKNICFDGFFEWFTLVCVLKMYSPHIFLVNIWALSVRERRRIPVCQDWSVHVTWNSPHSHWLTANTRQPDNSQIGKFITNFMQLN